MGKQVSQRKGTGGTIYITKFADTETRYQELERECLAVLRPLEEVRFLVTHAKYPVVIYTNANAMATTLTGGNEDYVQV